MTLHGAPVPALAGHDIDWRCARTFWHYTCTCGHTQEGDGGPSTLDASVTAHWRTAAGDFLPRPRHTTPRTGRVPGRHRPAGTRPHPPHPEGTTPCPTR